MDKTRLKNIEVIKDEIRDITKEIEDFPQGIVADFAYKYPNGVKKVIPIVGYADCSYLRKRLEAKLMELQIMVVEVEDWLDTVEDEEICSILRKKYRYGMSHEQIGEDLGYEKSTISKKLNRYWREQNT